MKDIKNYLLQKDKSYSEGIDLLKKHSKNNEETNFLNLENPEKMHWKMLIKRLSNILRIASQKPAVREETKVQKPIIIKKNHFDDVKETKGKDLEHRKELTNKLIVRSWEELDEKEKAYFHNDEAFFERKYDLIILNSKIESVLKSLHASLPHAESDDQRKDIATRIASLKEEQNENWSIIDNFEQETPAQEETTDKAVDLLKKRNNLRSQIAKLKKTVVDKEHKNYNKRLKTLANAEKQLKEIEETL